MATKAERIETMKKLSEALEYLIKRFHAARMPSHAPKDWGADISFVVTKFKEYASRGWPFDGGLTIGEIEKIYYELDYQEDRGNKQFISDMKSAIKAILFISCPEAARLQVLHICENWHFDPGFPSIAAVGEKVRGMIE